MSLYPSDDDMYKQHLSETQPLTADSESISAIRDPTAEPPPDDAEDQRVGAEPRYGLPQRIDGILMTTVRWQTTTRTGLFTKTRAVESRTLRVENDTLVDTSLIGKLSILPQEGESVIRSLQRRHWFTCLGNYLISALVAIGGLVLLGWIGPQIKQPQLDGAVFIAGAVVILGSAAFAFMAWLHWAFTFIMATDRRVIKAYSPPYPLGKTLEESRLTDLLSPRLMQSVVGRVLGYGTVSAETAAEEQDWWLRKGISFVLYPDHLFRLVQGG